jgi:hypothetical protein
MELKPKLATMKTLQSGLAVVFGFYGIAVMVRNHDLHNGIWSLLVCGALLLGVLPTRWLSHQLSTMEEAGNPDPASKLHLT